MFGFPVVDVKVTCFDGKYHSVDSSEMSFKMAGSIGFKEAMAKADPILLEPISELVVVAPEANQGDIMGDLNSKRGRIQGSSAVGNGEVEVVALVPTSEVLRYTIDLRSMTGGRGRFTVVALALRPGARAPRRQGARRDRGIGARAQRSPWRPVRAGVEAGALPLPTLRLRVGHLLASRCLPAAARRGRSDGRPASASPHDRPLRLGLRASDRTGDAWRFEMLFYLAAGLVAFGALFAAAGIAAERGVHYGMRFFRRG